MTVADQSTAACSADHCITCADEGVPMVVLRVNEAAGLALCSGADGERMTVEAALVAPLSPGDSVLVHAGTAIATLAGASQRVVEARA
jgi:hydrogenase maturation factor